MPATDPDAVAAFADWLDTLPINLADHREHPDFHKMSCGFGEDDWRALAAEQRRRAAGAAQRAIQSAETSRGTISKMAAMIVEHRSGILDDPLFQTMFGDCSRSELRRSIAEAGLISAMIPEILVSKLGSVRTSTCSPC